MTKHIITKCVIALAVVGLCAFAGCKQKETTTHDVQGEVAAVDTTQVEKEFQTASPEVKSELDQAITSIKAGNHSDALDKLKSLANNAKLTPEQQQAIKDLLAKVQKSVAEGASKAVEGAEKALDDVKGALPK